MISCLLLFRDPSRCWRRLQKLRPPLEGIRDKSFSSGNASCCVNWKKTPAWAETPTSSRTKWRFVLRRTTPYTYCFSSSSCRPPLTRPPHCLQLNDVEIKETVGGDERSWGLWHEHRGSIRRYTLQGSSTLVKLSWLKDLKELQQRSSLPTNSKCVSPGAEHLNTVSFINLTRQHSALKRWIKSYLSDKQSKINWVQLRCVLDVCIHRSSSVCVAVVWLHIKDGTNNQADLQSVRISETRDQLAQRFDNRHIIGNYTSDGCICLMFYQIISLHSHTYLVISVVVYPHFALTLTCMKNILCWTHLLDDLLMWGLHLPVPASCLCFCNVNPTFLIHLCFLVFISGL